jgi:S-DNA-T family DNA segregation ATPase FtsK/SpoIIIE
VSLLDSFHRRRSDRHALRLDAAEVDALVDAWDRAAQGVGFVRTVSTVTGPTVIVPRIAHIVLGPPAVLTVRLEPGQTVADLRALSRRLAPHLAARVLRVEALGVGDYARVTLLAADPLADVLHLGSRWPADDRVWLARDEDGTDITADPVDLPHMIAQGQTRSGKSAWCYALLAQLAAMPDVTVAGVDASGLLLRPFAGSHHAAAQVCGLAELPRVETVLAELVAEMDRRIAAIAPGWDRVITHLGEPLVVVVLEEWPGVLRALDASAEAKIGKRVRGLVARLLAESPKAGMRVVMVAQRAEATLIGGAERAQLAARLSFRSDSPDSVKLLHPHAAADLAEHHADAADGVALLTMPGRPLSRVRAPWIGGYGEYAAAVVAACGPVAVAGRHGSTAA